MSPPHCRLQKAKERCYQITQETCQRGSQEWIRRHRFAQRICQQKKISREQCELFEVNASERLRCPQIRKL